MKANLFSITKLSAFLILTLVLGCRKDENNNPKCEIISPSENQEIVKGLVFLITVDVSDNDGTIDEVQFYVDGIGIGSSVTFPYNYPWVTLSENTGSHTIKIKCLDNAGGSSEDEVTVNLINAPGLPVAEFSSANPIGLAPHTVSFVDESTNYPFSWLWYFGDGGTSTEQNPTHTYQVSGDYTVSLMVTNLLGSDINEKIDFVKVSNGEPVANFTSNISQGVVPLSINFSDNSSFNPTNWYWDFGDGSQSTDQNPFHIYTIEGTYTVTLIVGSTLGKDTIEKPGYIVAQPFTVDDFDGNVYSTIIIGDQTWMKENLKTTHYSDGSPIPYVTDNSEWINLLDNQTDRAYCYYDNNTGSEYGALYTFAAALNGENPSNENPSGVQGVCPSGWHLPSDNEWKQLEMFLGMSQSTADLDDYRGTYEGEALKETGTDHWEYNHYASNLTGFTAFGGGYRYKDGDFYYLKEQGTWWSSTSEISDGGTIRALEDLNTKIGRFSGYKSSGFSVRCLKDKSTIKREAFQDSNLYQKNELIPKMRNNPGL
ncbi:MAG: PKD domain-containing protein [Bacteroidales bacterium]|nr:PKD domain-containing protein [Bacteroidales bacterium]MCF8458562.1 PKD domain-containing protein [Bacteroidales bacterium]